MGSASALKTESMALASGFTTKIMQAFTCICNHEPPQTDFDRPIMAIGRSKWTALEALYSR
ncbi:hypothetical protein Atai01_58270 [Amycolatopsis taiwanensis]|uniref:Uncharacterized protein n=1 Tax=Amycolatopsis taiwanensis TaxID=342230 RepID=A0A9W6R5S5_9PSEU|nr:hypothetical protein Atai01_58270 [Amycolatopsis taiwanensis]